MKIIGFILLPFLLFNNFNFPSKECIKQEQSSDRTWYIFKRGRPDKNWLEISEIEQVVAKKWGFAIEYVYGSGSSQHDKENKTKETCSEKNEKLFMWLKNKYGEDWQQKFSKEVATTYAEVSK